MLPATPTPTPTPAARFIDNGDGTITDVNTGLMWEKKDQSGGMHDENTYFVWAGQCGCTSGACTGNEPLCQPNAAAASLCAAETGGALGCAECSSGTCNVKPYLDEAGAAGTIWDWLVQLNAAGLAGHSDWRIPTVVPGPSGELGTIVDKGVPGCSTSFPYTGLCVDAVFDTDCTPGCTVTTCSCTMSDPYDYWSSTTLDFYPTDVFAVHFGGGFLEGPGKTDLNYVRAVRGGS
jgi:hypothetical protein